MSLSIAENAGGRSKQLLPPTPDPPSLRDRITRFGLIYFVFQPRVMIMIPMILYKMVKLSDLKVIYRLVSRANSRGSSPTLIQDPDLLEEVCALESAQPYMGQLEYQLREGYCAPATLRCVLKSFPSFPVHLLPPPTMGPSDPHKWSSAVNELAEASSQHHGESSPTLCTEIIPGESGYVKFLESVRKVNDPKYRVAINYLRPALVGFMKPWWIPIHLFLGLFGGYSSPILGVLEKEGEEEPLIAVFDVNAKYGLYLVRARTLYESVRAQGIMTGKSRAIVVVSQ